ncbi:MAG: DNA-binding protein [Planctomycetes bacterium]|nr:DNA-binding protein [Planctomycetota bacterium]
MKPLLYVETTIVSFLTARPSQDADIAALQRLTEQWWTSRRARFGLCVSALVELEAGAGDRDAAQRRLTVLHGLPRLAIDAEVDLLTEKLVLGAGFPDRARADADHLANPRIVLQVEATCRLLGYRAPSVCTPEQLMED